MLDGGSTELIRSKLRKLPEHGDRAGPGEGEQVENPLGTASGRQRGEEAQEEVGDGRPAQEVQQMIEALGQTVSSQDQVQDDDRQRRPAWIEQQPQQPANGGEIGHEALGGL